MSTSAGNEFQSCMGVSWNTGRTPHPPRPWMPRPNDPCVMYSEITKTANGQPSTVYTGAWGYIKCPAGSTNDTCASFGTEHPACNATREGCIMVALPKQTPHTGAVYAGKFSITPTSHRVRDLQTCNKLCLDTPGCVQTTWATSQGNAPPPPRVGCEIFHSIDMERPADGNCGRSTCGPFPNPNVQQWLVVGRRVITQHDFAVAKPSTDIMNVMPDVQRHDTPVTSSDSANVTFTQATEFPYGNGSVVMTLRVPDPGVDAVAIHLRLRIPSWLERAQTSDQQQRKILHSRRVDVDTSSYRLPVLVNGQLYGDGVPGSFLSVDRMWKDGDTISFALPMDLYTLTLYTGVDQIVGMEGRRYALSVGPVVLACVALPGHSMNKDSTVILPISATAAINSWLIPDPQGTSGFKRSYSIKGFLGYKFIPMWEIPSGVSFTTYPVYKAAHLRGRPRL